MTAGALLDAIEEALRERTLAPVAELWRTGYRPTAQELGALESVSFGPNPDVRAALQTKAHAKLRYRALRKAKVPVAVALAQAADEFNLHPETLRYIIAGKDRRVEALLAEWSAESPN